MLIEQPPTFFRRLFPAARFRMPEKVGDERTVYLTFDDGPSKYTKKLLNLFDQYHIQSTFFVVGENVKRYPKIIDQMIERGHVIGNHSYTHINFKTHSIHEINDEIQKSEDLLKKHNYMPYLLRPPYGAINPKLQTNYTIILWNNDSLDWKLKEKKAIIKQVTSNLKENQIILFHDLYPTTIEAMEELIPLLLSKGYYFQPIYQKKGL